MKNGQFLNKVLHGDCFEWLPQIEDNSIDMILCDLPYGTTKNKWDSTLPLDDLWKEYKRIIKDKGVIILFGQDKFTAEVMLSQPKLHRYNLIWNKELPSGFLNANRMPLRVHEDIMVFYKKLPDYHSQKWRGKKNHSKGNMKTDVNHNYGKYNKVDNVDELGDMKHPRSILTFPKPHPSIAKHPTQKSVELCEWLIKAFTKEGMTVLDNCGGSGTTAVASINTNRNFILMEKEWEYCKITNDWIKEVKNKLNTY